MKIDFERTGGHLPVVFAASLDTDQVTAEEAEQIRELIAHADLSHASHGPGRQAPDAFTYKLSVRTDDGERRQYELTEMEVSDSLRPLLRLLMKRARPGNAE